MKKLQITILGNGGCLNNGLPHNACLINGHLLVEAPPDVMVSLQKLHVDFKKIDTIFISHLHGDHTFGLPFIIINMWYRHIMDGTDPSLTILGPQGIEQYTKNITESAFTKSHPCYGWLEGSTSYRTIRGNFEMVLDDMSISCFKVQHLIETYGLQIAANNENVMAYIADTKWCPEVEQVLAGKPKVVLMDMNGGEPSVHVSLNEVIEKGLPITGNASLYYGTHLADEFESPHACIKCAKPGEELTIDY
jgi:ribonuclease BN (tRNA processing enzyme)